MIRYVGYILILTLVGYGCAREIRPELDEERYEKILIELELIHALHMQVMDDSLTQTLLDKVWDKYDISKDDFLTNHALYEQDLQSQVRRMQRISEYLNEEQLQMESRLYELREQERQASESEIP